MKRPAAKRGGEHQLGVPHRLPAVFCAILDGRRNSEADDAANNIVEAAKLKAAFESGCISALFSRASQPVLPHSPGASSRQGIRGSARISLLEARRTLYAFLIPAFIPPLTMVLYLMARWESTQNNSSDRLHGIEFGRCAVDVPGDVGGLGLPSVREKPVQNFRGFFDGPAAHKVIIGCLQRQ